MATHEFNVPVELIEAFAGIIVEKNLENEILGTTDNWEINFDIEYDKGNRIEKHAVYKVHEMFDEFYESDEDESE